MKNVKIEYSLDGLNWTELKGTGYPYQFAVSDGTENAKASNLNDGKNSLVNFGGIEARHVRITSNLEVNDGNWGGLNGVEEKTGLSEVRFVSSKPTVAYKPADAK